MLNRSAATFSMEFPNAVPLREMIPALLKHVGGVDYLCEVRDKVKPEYLEIDLALSVKFSEEQEGGVIWPATLSDLGRINAALSFQFL